jgi:hypothetical protein
MKIKKELVKRTIAGDTILVPVGKTVYESNGLFILNGVGAFLWDILPDAQTEEELLQAVLDRYDVQPEQAQRDIRAFLDKLAQMNIL